MLRIAEEKDALLWIELNGEAGTETKDLADIFEWAVKDRTNITLFMIEYREKTVGFANLMSILNVSSGGKTLIIDNLYIRPEYRGKGISRQSMNEIEEYAREKGIKKIQFQSEETDPKIKAFYASLGYVSEDMNFYALYI